MGTHKRHTSTVYAGEYSKADCADRDKYIEGDPPQEKPLCVQWCLNDTLSYEEREEGVDYEEDKGKLEKGVESIVDKYGLENVADTVARLAKNKL